MFLSAGYTTPSEGTSNPRHSPGVATGVSVTRGGPTIVVAGADVGAGVSVGDAIGVQVAVMRTWEVCAGAAAEGMLQLLNNRGMPKRKIIKL